MVYYKNPLIRKVVFYMKEVSINTDFIRLDQFLKWAGICESGAIAKELILSSNIKVNDSIVLQRTKKIYKGDIIEIDEIKYKVV